MSEPRNRIPLEGVTVLSDQSVEIARLWVTDGGGSTVFINARMFDPEMFGMLLADTAGHAANAYAKAMSITPEEALTRIWAGADKERANPSGSNELADPFGKSN